MANVVLPEALTIAAVRPLRTTLLEAFDGPAPYTLDGTQVDDVDGAGVQVLISAARELAIRDQRLHLRPSTGLRDTLRQLAVEDRFVLVEGDAA